MNGNSNDNSNSSKEGKRKKKATVENIAYSISMIVEIRPNRITINISNWTC